MATTPKPGRLPMANLASRMMTRLPAVRERPHLVAREAQPPAHPLDKRRRERGVDSGVVRAPVKRGRLDSCRGADQSR